MQRVDPGSLLPLAALRAGEGLAVLDALPAYDEGSALALASRLRDSHPPELVAAALTQARLRARAREKFGEAATRLWFTPEGLEQATRPAVAALRARRYRLAGAQRVADLCCGIGGDLLPLAGAGIPVLGVDHDLAALEAAAANAEVAGLTHLVELRCEDVRETDLTGCDAAFCDPARRDARGRRFEPESWSPPYSWLLELAERLPATGAKVAPGIAHGLVPLTSTNPTARSSARVWSPRWRPDWTAPCWIPASRT